MTRMDTEGGPKFINRIENVEYVEGVMGLSGKSFRRQSADDADGHGKGTGYPRNPCESVDKIDGRASADDTDGHGKGTGLSAQSVRIRGQNRLESVRG